MNWKIKNENKGKKNRLIGKYHPLILQLLANRGLHKDEEVEEYFSFDYEKCLDDLFKISGMEKAVKRIEEAKKKKEIIAIYGDYDADGVTATAVLSETFVELGFRDIIYYFPDRQTEGYGLNKEAVKILHEKGAKLIITVDCGITNVDEVVKAKELGLEIIVTDHHIAPDKLPDALSVIDPKAPESGFDFKELAGVGVAFKLAVALYQKLAPEKIEQLKWVLDLVAIGTVADCVPLTHENRTLVKYGLVVLSKTRRPGLLEIFKVGKINISENKIPDTHQLAFQVVPRINAAGRIDHASASYNVLVGKDPVSARVLALELEDKNKKRQKITAEIFREVQILAENSFKNRKFIFAENSHWPIGVLGLVAGKITEQSGKPSMILQRQEGIFAGSLRSVPEVNIMEVMKRCADLIESFGGHSQAAGVRVKPENLAAFCDKMSVEVEREFEGKEVIKEIEIDLEISPEEIDWALIADLNKMEPFGQGNPQPIFCARKMVVCDLKVVGNGQKHLKLSLRGESGSPKIFDAIGFSLAQKFPDLKKNDKIEIVFNLEEDEWNGNKKMQLRIIDIKMVK